MKKIIVLIMLVMGFIMLTGFQNMGWRFRDNNSSLEVKKTVDSCTGWIQQSNGCYWRECVKPNGDVYCEQCCGKGACSRVKCE